MFSVKIDDPTFKDPQLTEMHLVLLLYIMQFITLMLMNFIFVFCMVFPQQGIEQLKQPLNVLLGSLVGGNIALHVFTLLAVFFDLMSSSNALIYNITAAVMLYTMRISITSTLWLNVFYYCQIVPAQLSVFIWLKKNIRVFIYSALVVDRIFFLYGFTVAVVSLIKNGNCPANEVVNTKQNTTNLNKSLLVNTLWPELGYFSVSIGVMLVSSCATILYLQRHTRSMKESSRSFSSSRLQRQMRVTITGIIQALLYFFCSSAIVINEFISILLPSLFNLQQHIICTVILLCTFGTTINMGFGQSILRQGSICVWEKILLKLNLYACFNRRSKEEKREKT
uniref:Taste receptor type 2 n=1 Tax=Astyanax mexicanus TaxID=7994 RepID=A0A3B1J1B9_ASTMX